MTPYRRYNTSGRGQEYGQENGGKKTKITIFEIQCIVVSLLLASVLLIKAVSPDLFVKIKAGVQILFQASDNSELPLTSSDLAELSSYLQQYGSSRQTSGEKTSSEAHQPQASSGASSEESSVTGSSVTGSSVTESSVTESSVTESSVTESSIPYTSSDSESEPSSLPSSSESSETEGGESTPSTIFTYFPDLSVTYDPVSKSYVEKLFGYAELSESDRIANAIEFKAAAPGDDFDIAGDLIPISLVTQTDSQKTDSFAEKAAGGLLLAPAGCSYDPYFPEVALAAPLEGKITSAFGYRYHPITGLFGFHTGTDIAAAKGTKIAAAGDGVVSERGYSDVWGNYIVIKHSDSSSTFYAHCNTLNKKLGDTVKAGDKIATVGSTGWSTGPHLHFEVKINGRTMDPAWIIGKA